MSKNPAVLVTGAGGYIGRHVVQTLLDAGISVTAVDLHTDYLDQRANRLDYNIFSGNADIYKELGSPDICLHLAWKDGFFHNSAAHITFLSSHFTFLRDMIEGGLRHVAVMGTMHEIGYHEGEIDENTPTRPLSLYGVAKNALRQAMEIWLKERSDVTLQWLRAYYIYGDDKNNHSVFTKILEACQQGKKTFPLNSGLNQCDYISVDALSRQISAAILQDEVTGTINCCTGKPRSLKDIVDEFIKKNRLGISLQLGAFPDRPYDSPAVWGNPAKIQKILKSCAYPALTQDLETH